MVLTACVPFAVAEPRVLGKKEISRVKQVFASIDEDGSGAIEMDEVITTDLGCPLSLASLGRGLKPKRLLPCRSKRC